MRILLSKPDALGDQFIAAGIVQQLLARQPDLRLVWHVQAGKEVIAPLLGAEVFIPDWRQVSPQTEAARLAAHPGRLVLLPYPLAAHEPWDDEVRQRVRWWHAFLQATTWDAIVLGLVNRNWVGDFTAAVAPAPRRLGFGALPMRQPLVNEAQALAGVEEPVFTSRLTPSFDRSEARQLLDLFALLEPDLRELPGPPAWQPGGSGTSKPPDSGSRRIALAPGVGGDSRRAWPLDNFVALAQRLRTGGAEVSWIEGPGDAPFLVGLPAGESAARRKFGADELGSLVQSLAEYDLLICHDTAYAHIAAGLDLPTVAIFGGGQGARFHPLGGRAKVLQGHPPCAGCQWHCLFDRLICVADLSVATVQRAAEDALAGDFAPRRVELPVPAGDPGDQAPGLVRRLQEEILQLNADRFARLQIIQSLTAPTKRVPTPPRLSVIIPMGRPERVTATLHSLAAQDIAGLSWEIVLVGTQAEPVAQAHRHLPIRPVQLPRAELPPRTRCLGVEQARGEWLLFVDDDVELSPDFFRRSAGWMDRNEADLGALGPRLPGKSPRFFGRVTDYGNFWAQQDGRAEDREWLYSAALLIRGEAYRKSGGFNPDLPNGEDVDLTRRIRAAGYRLRYDPAVVAWHAHGRDGFWTMCRYFWRNGNAARYFFAHHGGACCFSLRTALSKPWSDLAMNRAFRQRHGESLGALTPWILLAYHIVEFSLEYHYQQHLWRSGAYAELPARTAGDRTYVRAMGHFRRGRHIRGAACYAWALLLDLGNPVRR